VSHGVNRHHERIAAEVRGELSLLNHEPLDPFEYARLLRIPCEPVSKLDQYGVPEEILDHLAGAGRRDFSAGTFCKSNRRLIVYNDHNSPARQKSDVAHELAHVLLEHEPGPGCGFLGLPVWNAEQEDEATCLAGALLVPECAALAIVRRGLSVWESASIYGVSDQLMEVRLEITAAFKRVVFAAEWAR
jgi:IrrE N-terminal-like domain